MQSAEVKFQPSFNLERAIEVSCAALLIFLTAYQFKFRELIMVKTGMSQFFSPQFVGVLPYVLIAVNIVSVLLLIGVRSSFAALPTLLVLLGYTTYNIALLIKTGDSCGCANMFLDWDLRYQAAIGSVFVLLTLTLIIRLRSKNRF